MSASVYNKTDWGWKLKIGQCFLLQVSPPVKYCLDYVKVIHIIALHQAVLPAISIFPWLSSLYEEDKWGAKVLTPVEMVL